MMNANSAAPGMPGSAIEELRLREAPTFRLMPVPSPARVLAPWNRKVADWMAA
jgi:hypothetical protein